MLRSFQTATIAKQNCFGITQHNNYVPSLEEGKAFPKIVRRERAGKDVTGEADSGDEQVPDLPCVPPFSAEELPVVEEK